jgi:hypothetical protein
MYNLKPSDENISLNNLFTPTFPITYQVFFQKAAAKIRSDGFIPNLFRTSVEEWRYGSMEVKSGYRETRMNKGFQRTVNEMCLMENIFLRYCFCTYPNSNFIFPNF